MQAAQVAAMNAMEIASMDMASLPPRFLGKCADVLFVNQPE
ncbi:hypothetical protein PMI41_04425 [Phyllobacterium sp. YR531]|nr:hypothetical protein PMI41_04425 [Phyllobacterium sp. YR531]